MTITRLTAVLQPKNVHYTPLGLSRGTRHDWQYVTILVLNAVPGDGYPGYVLKACYSGRHGVMDCYRDNDVARVDDPNTPQTSPLQPLGNTTTNTRKGIPPMPLGVRTKVQMTHRRNFWGKSTNWYLERGSSDVGRSGGRVDSLVDWDRLPERARTALNVYDWGDDAGVRCPINDHNFSNLIKESLKDELGPVASS